MTIIPELDYKQTRDNARRVLKSCRSLQRKSGVTVSLQSPMLSDMPRHQSNRNNIEHSVIKSVELVNKWQIQNGKESRNKLYAINRALQSLSDVSREILYHAYVSANGCSNVKLSRIIKVYKEAGLGQVEEITYSIKNIEKLKGEALIEFAEAYKYEKLLVCKN